MKNTLKQTILVIGASGTVGKELSRLLKEEGLTVQRATSREATSADQVQLNLVTGEGIRSAFDGVDKAFLLSPPGYADQYSVLSPLIQEAKRRGLKKVVLMTAMGADADERSPFRRAEVELEKSGLDYNILRPNWFMQNFASFWIQGILDHGKILLPAGTAKTSFIDAKDIAAVAARLLTSNEYPKHAFDLTGPEALNHSEVAAVLSKATGKRITYEEITPGTLQEGLEAAGLPRDYVAFLLMIFGYLREGYNAATTPVVKELLGRDGATFEQYATSNRGVWA